MIFHVAHTAVQSLVQPAFQPPRIFIKPHCPGYAAVVKALCSCQLLHPFCICTGIVHCFHLILRLLFKVQFVKNPVNHRGQYQAYVGDEHNSTEKCVQGREYFSGAGGDGNYRAHAAQDHGSIVKGIDGGCIGQAIIACKTNHQADRQHQAGQYQLKEYPLIKYPGWGKGLAFMLVHFFI